ncbi:MAG: TlpA family protein disulfide reductase [Actinomycetota bacterium]
MIVVVAVETVVLALLTLLVAGLLRSHAEILRRLHTLGADLDPDAIVDAPITLRPRGDVPAGTTLGAAHDLAGAGLRDDALHIPVVGVRNRTLLAFLSSGCLTCRTFWDAFAGAAALRLPSDVRLVAVTKDAADESLSTLLDVAPRDLPVVMSSDAWREYDVPGSPYFVLVDGQSGTVEGEGTGVTWDQVRGLIARAGGDEGSTELRIDRELLAHGIEPGHDTLYLAPADARS